MITRSGIEVAMDSEAERPVIRVFREVRTAANSQPAIHEYRRALGSDEAVTNSTGVHLLVQHIHAHVEGLGDVPLRARTYPPGVPVSVAPDISPDGGCECGAGAEEVSCGGAVRHRRVAAVHRRPPARVPPEVFVGRIDVPPRGQL